MIACQLIFGKDNVFYAGWFFSQCVLNIYALLYRKYRCISSGNQSALRASMNYTGAASVCKYRSCAAA